MKTTRKTRSSTKSAEDKLWKIFSEYVRLRDTDDRGYGFCCTCGKPLHWKDGDAGHFIGRRYKNLKFNEQNVSLQCRACNRFNSGVQYKHGKHIDRKWGQGTADMLVALQKQTAKMTAFEYTVLIEEYTSKVKSMKEKKA